MSACGSDESWLSGTIVLANGVDPSMFETLELRVIQGVGEAPSPGAEPEGEPVVVESLALEGLEFPHALTLSGEGLADAEKGWLVGWVTARPDPRWPEPGEPFGIVDYALCSCATHTPPYAEDLMVTLAP